MSVTPLGCCLKCRPSDPKRYTWRLPNPGTKTWEVFNGQTATKGRSFRKFPQVEFHRMLDFQHSLDHHVSNLLKNLVKIPNASPTWKNSLNIRTGPPDPTGSALKCHPNLRSREPILWGQEPKHLASYYWNWTTLSEYPWHGQVRKKTKDLSPWLIFSLRIANPWSSDAVMPYLKHHYQ